MVQTGYVPRDAPEPDAKQENRHAGDGIVFGVSGWFTPHGVRYREAVRWLSEIAPADWFALLDHADRIDFFNRAEPPPAGPSDRIFHLTITAGKRVRELASNDPVNTPELAHLIRPTPRALRDRQVLSLAILNDVQFAMLQEALQDAREHDRDDDPARINA